MSPAVQMKILAFVVTLSLVLGPAKGANWFWESDEHRDRDLDGSLKCYQCDTANEWQKVCMLGKWKHANMTEKRNMTMQCPRRKSAFCHLVIAQDDREMTVRGCSGPRHADNKTKAKVGCFKMAGDNFTNRVCLCDTDLCNRATRPLPWWQLAVSIVATTTSLVFYKFMLR